jgi:hypothetical protein
VNVSFVLVGFAMVFSLIFCVLIEGHLFKAIVVRTNLFFKRPLKTASVMTINSSLNTHQNPCQTLKKHCFRQKAIPADATPAPGRLSKRIAMRH